MLEKESCQCKQHLTFSLIVVSVRAYADMGGLSVFSHIIPFVFSHTVGTVVLARFVRQYKQRLSISLVASFDRLYVLFQAVLLN